MQSLEKNYKKLSLFFGNVLSTLASLLKILLQSRISNTRLPQPAKPRCVILGNGPSLSTFLSKSRETIAQDALFCVNSFSMTAEYQLLKPTYYILHDPSYWVSDVQLPKDVFNAIVEKTTWPLTIFMPAAAQKSTMYRKLEENINVKIHFYNYSVFKGFDFAGNFFFRNNLAMPQAQNVLVAALFLSINMKFEEVFLLGADHTWHENLTVDENNVLCIKDYHFYDDHTEVKLKPLYRHLHSKEVRKVGEVFESLAKAFNGYLAIERYARYCGVKVYNASEVSFIDAFERRKLD